MLGVHSQHLAEQQQSERPDSLSGTAGLGPTGTGMTISGGRYDTITNNIFIDNGAWGMAFVPYPEGNLTSDGRTCRGTGGIVANIPQDLRICVASTTPGWRHVVRLLALGERVLRQPRQCRLRQPHRRRRPAGELLLGQRSNTTPRCPTCSGRPPVAIPEDGHLGRPPASCGTLTLLASASSARTLT